MKLSIVIPVYNTEAWLRKCLDSLLSKGAEDSGTDSGNGSQTPVRNMRLTMVYRGC